MPTLVTHLTTRDRSDLAAVLALSATGETETFRARRLARVLDVRDLYDVMVRPTVAGCSTPARPKITTLHVAPRTHRRPKSL